MAIVNIETDVVEQMNYKIRRATDLVEDTEAHIRQTMKEMQEDTVDFYGLVYWDNVCRHTEAARNKIRILAERLENFSVIFQTIAQDYDAIEEKYVKEIQKLTLKTNALILMLENSLSQDCPSGIQEAENNSGARKLEQDLAKEKSALELTNLAALSKVVEEEYSVEKVIPVPHMSYITAKDDIAEDENDN